MYGGLALPQLVRYVILSDLYVDLLDIVDSSLIHLLEGN